MEKMVLKYQERYEKELEKLRKYLSFLEMEAGKFWKYDSSDMDYQYIIERTRVTKERIQKLEYFLSWPNELLEMGREEDLKQYRERYEKKIADLTITVGKLNAALDEQIKHGFDFVEERDIRASIDECHLEIQQLREILKNPEKLLEKGIKDDSKEQEEVQQDFLEKKKNYESFNLLNGLKYRLQFLDLFSSASQKEQNERGK